MGYSRTEVLGRMQKGKSRAKQAYHEVHNKGGTGDKTAGPKVAGGLDGLCYVRVEHSAQLELAGYDQVTLPVVNGASASSTR